MIFFSICESEQNIFQEGFFHVWNWDKGEKKIILKNLCCLFPTWK